MAQSIKRQIQLKLIARIESLDWVTSVTSRDVENFDFKMLPAVVVSVPSWAPVEEGVGAGRQDHEIVAHITIKTAGNESEDAADEYLVSLVASIGEDITFDGLAYDAEFGPGDIDMADATKLITDIQQLITIRYRTSIWSI